MAIQKFILRWLINTLNNFKLIKNNCKIKLLLQETVQKVNSFSFAKRNQKISCIRVICADFVALAIKYLVFISNLLFDKYFTNFVRLICHITTLYPKTLWNNFCSQLIHLEMLFYVFLMRKCHNILNFLFVFINKKIFCPI